MVYRTGTYIAAAWSEDIDAVEEIRKWSKSNHWGLTFKDSHELTSSRDGSLICTIKRNMKTRLDVSKQFVLIVGEQTKALRAGSCQYCDRYIQSTSGCTSGYSTSTKSYIDYECDVALADIKNIVVLYKSTKANKSKCPVVLKDVGTHVAMWYTGDDGKTYWDYNAVKKAMGQ